MKPWKDKHCNLYGLYDVRCNDCCAGIFTMHQAMLFLGIARRSFYAALKSKVPVQGVYRIEFVCKGSDVDE